MKRFFLMLFVMVGAYANVYALETDFRPESRIMPYNNPEATDFLGVGLWALPVPVDYDGDGVKDLVVICPDRPYKGTYFFRNIGTAREPFFDNAVLISKKVTHHLFSTEFDGKTYITDNGQRFESAEAFLARPYDGGIPIEFEGEQFRQAEGRSRNNQWAEVDWDGDGDMDYVAAYDTWNDYGWDNAFDAQGRWTRGPLHGFLYLIENENGKYINRGRIQAGGKDIDIFGTVSPCIADFDKDGDLDIITGEFVDGFSWIRNIGTREKPVFEAPRQLSNSKGEIRMHLEMIQPRATDWDGDGDMDLVVGDEDGRVALMFNTGKVKSGMPQFTSPEYLRKKSEYVKFGALATPCSFDWDGDGDEDIICGNSSGEIAFIENLGGGSEPVWAEPVNFKVGGKTFRVMAGENGSIQGPAERKWGYTVLSVADWDGDGRADIIFNSIWGKIQWLRNPGKKDILSLEAPRDITVDWTSVSGESNACPKPAWNWWNPTPGTLTSQWRTTPVAIDWNKDGLMDLIMLDHEGYLAYFERAFDKKGNKVLLPGKRIFRCINGNNYRNKKGLLDKETGELLLNDQIAGASGRRKICFVDWDLDGKLDMIVDGTNAVLFRGLGEKNGKYLFDYKGDLSSTVLEGHTTCPTPVDWDKDGVCDLLLGGEDGHFHIVKNPMSAQETITLYPERNLEDKSVRLPNGYWENITCPELLVYLPDASKANGQAMLITPGGSYGKNCITFEGYKTARWLNDNGIAAFILKYRLPAGNPDVILEDGQKAMSIIRDNAEKFGIDRHQVGIIGFSAGGHFATTMVTKCRDRKTRPDFGVLVYPVTSMYYDNAQTSVNLLGDKLSELADEWTLKNSVHADMPPFMIVMCGDDKTVDPVQVKEFYDAAVEAGANAQIHFYPSGGHGFWMRDRYRYGRETYPMIINWIKNKRK